MAATQKTRSICSYCGVGCGVLIEHHSPTGTIELQGDADYPVNRGMLCAKGLNLHQTVMNREDRLIMPMMRSNRQMPLEDSTWDATLTRVAKVFKTMIDKFGPDSVGFYVSGQLLTEEYYIANKLMKGFIGSNNIDTNSRLCMSSAVVAQKKAFGEDAVPICYDDIEHADCILISGANPAWCHPILFRRMEAVKLSNPEVRWIVIDPRQTQSTQMADLHLQIIPGTDVEVFHGMARRLIETEQIDNAFIREHLNGFEDLRAHVMGKTLAQYAQAAGITEADLIQAADWIGRAKGFLSMWAQGLNQSAIAVNKNLALINLSLITGKIGRAGNGPFSLTGQPNAMGGREVGGLATMLAVHKDIQNPEHRAQVADFWGVPTAQISDQVGLTATEMFEALEAGRMKAVWIMCTNPIVSMPDAKRIEAALAKANFVVVQEISKSSATLAFADVVLPAAGYMEKTGTMTNSERRVSLVQKMIEPPGQALSDAEILWRFADKMGWKKSFNYRSYEDIFKEYARQTQGTNVDVSGVSYALLRERSVQWPYPKGTLDGAETPRLFTDGRFYTESGRANLFAVPTENTSEPLTQAYPLILNTGRIRDQWHTMTRTGKVNKLNQHIPEPFLEIHPLDAQIRGIADGALVDVSSARGKVRVRAQHTASARQGVVFLPMHWGRKINFSQPNMIDDVAHDAGRANNLTQTRIDPMSKQPDFKYSAVQVAPVRVEAKKVIVIGAGAGGAQFAQSYREANPLAEIHVFSQEANPFYNRILLPDYLSSHKDWQALQILPAHSWADMGVHVHAGIGITRILPTEKTVMDSQGNVHAYDALVVATGSRAFIPNDMPAASNLLGIRQKEDVDTINQQLQPQSNIVVIGGGLLGLEMADSFHQLGHTVRVVQISDRLMGRQLDGLSADLLKTIIERKGIHVHLNDEITHYTQTDGKVTQVKLKSGVSLPTDLIIAAIGTRPNIELLKEANITCQYGVCVNEYMRTSDADVYAIGEIAQLHGQIWGISPAAQEQAKIVAKVLSGDPHAYYTGSTFMNILKLHDVQLASIGMTDVPSKDAHEYQVVRLEDINRHYYKKCIIHQNRLVGAILLGNKDEFNEFRRLIADGVELNETRDTLLRPNGVQQEPLSGVLVCACNNVGDGNIKKCIKNGVTDLDGIMLATGAGTGCGSCKPEVLALLNNSAAVPIDASMPMEVGA